MKYSVGDIAKPTHGDWHPEGTECEIVSIGEYISLSHEGTSYSYDEDEIILVKGKRGKYKVGDKVVTTDDTDNSGYRLFPIGTRCTVVRNDGGVLPYELEDPSGGKWWYAEGMFKLSEDQYVFKIGDDVELIKDTSIYKIGDKGTIDKIDSQSSMRIKGSKGTCWVAHWQLKLCAKSDKPKNKTKKPTKSDSLQIGDTVRVLTDYYYKKGSVGVIMADGGSPQYGVKVEGQKASGNQELWWYDKHDLEKVDTVSTKPKGEFVVVNSSEQFRFVVRTMESKGWNSKIGLKPNAVTWYEYIRYEDKFGFSSAPYSDRTAVSFDEFCRREGVTYSGGEFIYMANKEQFDFVMSVLEKKGWKWCTGRNPTEYVKWEKYIRYEDGFGKSSIAETYTKEGKTMVTFDEFCRREGVKYPAGKFIRVKNQDEYEFTISTLKRKGWSGTESSYKSWINFVSYRDNWGLSSKGDVYIGDGMTEISFEEFCRMEGVEYSKDKTLFIRFEDKEKYHFFLKTVEAKGWTWSGGSKPTDCVTYSRNIGVEYKNSFCWSEEGFYYTSRPREFKEISFDEFCRREGVTMPTKQDINKCKSDNDMNVICTTRSQYNELMQIYTDKGWRWSSGDKPKDFDGWMDSPTCISIGNRFGRTGSTTGIDISFDEFLRREGLSSASVGGTSASITFYKEGDIVMVTDETYRSQWEGRGACVITSVYRGGGLPYSVKFPDGYTNSYKSVRKPTSSELREYNKVMGIKTPKHGEVLVVAPTTEKDTTHHKAKKFKEVSLKQVKR